MTISSNTAEARQIATAIAASLDSLNASATVLLDSQTTVSGNDNAKEAVQSARSAANKVIAAVGTASTNLQSVASEFEAADYAARQIMSSLAVPFSPKGVV